MKSYWDRSAAVQRRGNSFITPIVKPKLIQHWLEKWCGHLVLQQLEQRAVKWAQAEIPWSWELMSLLSPWSGSCLTPVCITQQGQPASHFLGHPLGLPGAGNQNSLKKYTATTKSKPRVEILWEAKLFSAQPSNQAYRVVSGPYSHPLWGSQLLPTSSWPSPGASQGWGSAAQWAGRQPRTTCPLLQCPHSRPSFPTPADLYHMGSHILGFLRLCQIWF